MGQAFWTGVRLPSSPPAIVTAAFMAAVFYCREFCMNGNFVFGLKNFFMHFKKAVVK